MVTKNDWFGGLVIFLIGSLWFFTFAWHRQSGADARIFVTFNHKVQKTIVLKNNFMFILRGTKFFYMESATGEMWWGDMKDQASLDRIDPEDRVLIVNAYKKELHARS